MRWDDFQLTDHQPAFAEENHGLLLKFLSSNQLDEDYYSVLVERYLKTVVKYLESSDLQRYRFSTILWKNLRSELSNYWRTLRDSPTIMELDDDAIVPESAPPMDDQVWSQIEARLTSKQVDAIFLRDQGFSNREIGEICHVSEKAIEKRFARIRKVLKQNL